MAKSHSQSQISQVVEIEIVAPQNRNVIFKPIGGTPPLRGRQDHSLARTRTQMEIRDRWKDPIPGQRICMDFSTGEKWIAEPLHYPEYEEQRALVLSRGYALPKKRVVHDGESLVTWCYHASKLVKAGLAKVVVGELPDWRTLDGKPKRRFIVPEVESTEERIARTLDSVVEAIKVNTEMVIALTEKIAGSKRTG